MACHRGHGGHSSHLASTLMLHPSHISRAILRVLATMQLLATSACSNKDDSSSASVCCSCSYSCSGWLLHCHGREFLPKEGHPVSLAILVLEDRNTSRPLGHHPEALDLAIPLEDMSLLH